VDHGHHALFDLDFFLKVGGYDESFRCNEDAELDVRIRQAGGKIWMCAPAAIDYFPRASVRGLIRQYWNHGIGRGHNIAKHRLVPKLRQLLPVAALAVNMAAFAIAALYPPALIVPLLYVLGCVTWGFCLAFEMKDRGVAASGLASMIMHMCWAAGLITGFAIARVSRRGGQSASIPAIRPPQDERRFS
jgi:succinoglycan biosynthesis protein ExoA